ncbi:MAG: RDD family protein [Saprospiraceae bacterium]|nr:RDD family protein [Saprospiraceae bacterium]
MDDNTLLDTNLEDRPAEFEYASSGQRFANYIVDQIVLYILSGIGGVVLGTLSPSIVEDETGLNFVSIFIAIAISLAYYTFMEGSTGKSVGKYVTGTRALTEDGEPLPMNKAFVRSLCRLIPFEAFSFLGSIRGWHDTISKTMVVRDR